MAVFPDMLIRSDIFPLKKFKIAKLDVLACCSCSLLLSCLFFWDKQQGVDTSRGYCLPTAHRRRHLFSLFFPTRPEEFQNFVGKLPTHYAVNTSVVEHLWRTDASLPHRYRQLETSTSQLLAKARHTANKLFSLSKRCRKQPKIVLQRPR